VTYDALLYVSFGGPERPEDVMPFLDNVVRGRDVPRERLLEVAEHYYDNGGRSPINGHNRALIAALEASLADAGVDLPILWGNRNWDPDLTDALEQARAAGHDRLLAFVTSAYSSYSGCRQYREDLATAQAEVGSPATIDKIRVFFNHPGFVVAQTDHVREALATLDATVRDTARLVFVTHSLPTAMARHSDYVAQHYEAARLVAAGLDQRHDWDLVYCSRSGPPQVPWLEPDVGDHLAHLRKDGVEAVVVVPIGFVADHMEVIHDLDVEAREVADDVGLAMARAGTVGTHPAFVAGVRDLILERLRGAPRQAAGTMGPWHDACPLDCCLRPEQAAAATVVSQLVTDARTRYGADAVCRIDVPPDLLDGAMDAVLRVGGRVGTSHCEVDGVEIHELPEGQSTARAWVAGDDTPRVMEPLEE
jgi:ferrochelatase